MASKGSARRRRALAVEVGRGRFTRAARSSKPAPVGLPAGRCGDAGERDRGRRDRGQAASSFSSRRPRSEGVVQRFGIGLPLDTSRVPSRSRSAGGSPKRCRSYRPARSRRDANARAPAQQRRPSMCAYIVSTLVPAPSMTTKLPARGSKSARCTRPLVPPRGSARRTRQRGLGPHAAPGPESVAPRVLTVEREAVILGPRPPGAPRHRRHSSRRGAPRAKRSRRSGRTEFLHRRPTALDTPTVRAAKITATARRTLSHPDRVRRAATGSPTG